MHNEAAASQSEHRSPVIDSSRGRYVSARALTCVCVCVCVSDHFDQLNCLFVCLLRGRRVRLWLDSVGLLEIGLRVVVSHRLGVVDGIYLFKQSKMYLMTDHLLLIWTVSVVRGCDHSVEAFNIVGRSPVGPGFRSRKILEYFSCLKTNRTSSCTKTEILPSPLL